MPILKRRTSTRPERAVTSADFEVLEVDDYARVLDEAPLPAGDVVVTLARFLAERETLLARAGRLGVRVPESARLDPIVPDLGTLARIELPFPKFTDGRSYTHARRLRDEHGYLGEVMAVGDVLRDQLLYMHRCGFSSFELARGVRPESALRAFDETTVHYQAAADQALPLWKRARRPGA